MIFRIWMATFLVVSITTSLTQCKKSATRQLDELLESQSSFVSATFCEKNKNQLVDRKDDCDQVTKSAKEEIDSILNRKLDLGIAPVIVDKTKGKEIEEFLQIHTQMGIRYWEIWKANVILE
ncbi:hypothetical protein ND856_00070 [Leptospira bandrabouensis]|nr:hypothetical protein [Leptospira bandrabouensis]MCG6144591.1 hypothetical protein [Leptospira bandrabouensis]MCG6150401.1 hypothetical protein [Leptospira bandrabouensis]MCG6160252.1 hypothetical protein [Leptospira bandrabouensis]MCG6164185.1 hypothetical protein [Leptospira bandrabouensis]MCW7456714.1 hypothetical protein [Leptospira bandrabouensis]